MKIAGVIAEYNPFHNGHKYHLQRTRDAGATHIIAVMSGNFVQRGEPAIFDKWVRARAALLGGADVVVELPTEYACATAQKFASAAVDILNMCGVNMISFGSECADVSMLKKTASAFSDNRVDDRIGELLGDGMTYAAARSMAVGEYLGREYEKILQNPNDILAVEYINAISEKNIQPYAVKRQGAAHDSNVCTENITSASNIRSMIVNNINYAKYLPENIYPLFENEIKNGTAPAMLENGQKAVMWQLRQMNKDDFCRLADISEGLGNRLYNAACSSSDLNSFYESAKTKRYTLARIKRLALYATLGIYDYPPIEYVKILGFNKNAQSLLGHITHSSPLPVITNYSQAKKYGIENMYEREAGYTDFYTLLMPSGGLEKGCELTRSIVKI